MPSPQGGKGIFTWANLRLPAEGNSFAVAKAIDNRDCGAVVAAGVVPNIDDHTLQSIEVTSNAVQSGGHPALSNALQLEDANVTERPRPAIVEHPGLGL